MGEQAQPLERAARFLSPRTDDDCTMSSAEANKLAATLREIAASLASPQAEPAPVRQVRRPDPFVEILRSWNEAYPRMDIYSKPGTVVMFDGRGGYEGEQKHAKEKLTMRGLYEVERMSVGSCSSTVKLKGVDGSFNTVMFSAAPEPAPGRALMEQRVKP